MQQSAGLHHRQCVASIVHVGGHVTQNINVWPHQEPVGEQEAAVIRVI